MLVGEFQNCLKKKKKKSDCHKENVKSWAVLGVRKSSVRGLLTPGLLWKGREPSAREGTFSQAEQTEQRETAE